MSLFSAVNLRLRLVFLVLLAVLPALGVTLYTGLEHRSLKLSEARDNALNLAQEVSRAHEDIFDNARQVLSALSQLPQVYQQDHAACSIIFARLLKQSQGFTNIVACDLQGNTFATVTPLPTPINFSDRPWFQRVVQTRDFVIGEYQIGRINGKAQVVLETISKPPEGAKPAKPKQSAAELDQSEVILPVLVVANEDGSAF